MQTKPFYFFFVLFCLHLSAFAAPTTIDEHIKIDQFGYQPDSKKIAVISNPITGYNAPDTFFPAVTYEVRDWNTDAVVFTNSVMIWKAGMPHTQSGDQVWHFDFTPLTTPGVYYIFDTDQNVGSGQFEIAEDVYLKVLKTAVRSYYYQRCNMEKAAPYAETGWTDGNNFVGTEQDSECRLVTNPTLATEQDLTGGWFDAGDYNKYINFADGVIHDLVSAYEQNPTIWGDDYNIPESGNGVPDLLDEIKWEMDWFLKMQQADGSVLHKISVTDFSAASPPSADTGVRRYAPATASATISACGAFAHAAIVFKSLSDPAMIAYGNTLETAAEDAWNWLVANPGFSNYNNAGFVNAAAEDNAGYDQPTNRACAAVYLFALTGNTTYRAYFDAYWPNVHLNQWFYAYPFEDEYQDACLYYTTIQNATSSVVSEILSRYESGINHPDSYQAFLNGDDAYLAHVLDNNMVWGSNGIKSVKGSMFYNMIEYAIDPPNNYNYRTAAEGYIHYIHGVNPQGMVYLSNMYSCGAELSANEFYHSWFTNGSPLWDRVGVSTYGPAPGFLTGGANPNFTPDGACGCTIEPPQNQPILKSYHDWNTSWPENSWEITENSITYQSAYIKLLSKMVALSPSVEVQIQVFLEGAYNASTGLMNTALRDDDLLPASQPFNRLPWQYNGSESVTNVSDFPTDMVDWVLVEVRDAADNHVIVEQKAALLLADGSVVDISRTDNPAVSGVLFTNLTANANYYVSIKSRNHLAVLSANAVQLPNASAYDFTVVANVAGTGQVAEVATGIFACLAGDFDSNGTLSVADFNLYTTQTALINMYVDSDTNLDKNVTVADFNYYLPNSSVIGVAQIRY